MMKNKDSMSRPAPAETGAAAVSGEPHTEAGAGDGMEAPALLPCPFCGGKASDGGHVRYSRPLEYTTWEDGSPITEAFFCNCISCGVSNMVSSIGYRTKNDAVAAWSRRAQLAAMTAERDALAGAVIEQAAEIVDRRKSILEVGTELSSKIRALATHDHNAALEAVKAKARAEGMRKAAAICETDAERRDAQAAELAASGAIPEGSLIQHARWVAGAVGARLNRDAILDAAQKEEPRHD